MTDHVVEESFGASQGEAVDSLGGFSGVLEAHTKVGTAGAGALRWLNFRRGVSNHLVGFRKSTR